MYHKLTYQAPSREWVQTERGHASQQWTLSGVLICIAAGGWFGSDSQHSFELGVGAFAREAQDVLRYLRGINHANTQ